MNSSLRGYNRTFESLVFCISIEIKKQTNLDCLLRCGGAFVRTMRTLEKLDACREEQMRFLLHMVVFFCSILIERNAIWDAVPSGRWEVHEDRG